MLLGELEQTRGYIPHISRVCVIANCVHRTPQMLFRFQVVVVVLLESTQAESRRHVVRLSTNDALVQAAGLLPLIGLFQRLGLGPKRAE